MVAKHSKYFAALKEPSRLDQGPVARIVAELGGKGFSVAPVPQTLLRSNAGKDEYQITEALTRLQPQVVTGPAGWSGLALKFPGTTAELTTYNVGTPYLRQILYPMLELRRRIKREHGEDLPCLYILGARFPDVFLRKLRLLSQVIPHVIVLTTDLLDAKDKPAPERRQKHDELWTQAELCHMMVGDRRLPIDVAEDALRLRYLTHELPTGEGTQKPERLDILAVDELSKALVAFEIKGPGGERKRVDLENLFLQGLEHRNWLEHNKMAVKLLFDGPKGRQISTKKRVRLLLGWYGDYEPPLFDDLRYEAVRHDPYLRIDFVRLADTGDADSGDKVGVTPRLRATSE